MTQIYAELEGGRCLLAVDGHATGSAEVCAAISGLVYALAGYAANAESEGRAEIFTEELESGKVRLHLHGDDRTVGACEAILIGLLQIAEQFPEYVQMEFGDEKF